MQLDGWGGGRESGGVETSCALFWKWKKCSDFGKSPDCIHLCVKFSIQNAVLIVSKRKMENFIFCARYPTFFMTSFKFSWTILQLSFSIFSELCSASRDLVFANIFKLVFHNCHWNSLHVIYLYILKSVKIFKQRTNWKNSF